MLEKLSALEKKVIVGGVDLLAKAEEQENFLKNPTWNWKKGEEEQSNFVENLRKKR